MRFHSIMLSMTKKLFKVFLKTETLGIQEMVEME